LKRVREIKVISATRLREGDAVLGAVRGSTKDPLAIFSNLGSCYVMRIVDVPASTGYGEPVQKLFNFKDGERVVAAMLVSEGAQPKGTKALGVTKRGYGFRFDLDPHRELSTRAGRKYARVSEGDELVGVLPVAAKDVLCMVTANARAALCKAEEAPELANPGRGVTMIKVAEDDAVMGFGLGGPKVEDVIIAETESGKKIPVGPGRYQVSGRGGKGHPLAKRMKIASVSAPAPTEPPKLLN
jgi:DNA gyrase subunit A